MVTLVIANYETTVVKNNTDSAERYFTIDYERGNPL